MKITLFMLMIMVMGSYANSMAQKVTLSLTNAKIDRVFNEIRKQTNYRFLYSDEVLRESTPITINVADAEVTEALDRVVAQSNLKYKLIAGTVTVSLATPSTRDRSKDQPQDEIVVTGTVADETGAPLMQASVVVKGVQGKGTNTDADGKFSFSVPQGATLVISYIGYQAEEIVAQAEMPINIRLDPVESELGEVVVTALGISREKKSLGYASQGISGDEVGTTKAGGNIANALSGKVAGVDIRRSTNMGGSTNVIIRGNKSLTGNNQALWVVDGIPLDNSVANSETQSRGEQGYDYGNMAADINPDDIESINVLKGAAATALYGSRASNGVILVTTKKGGLKERPTINVNLGVTVGVVDRSTFTGYQKLYGPGNGRINGVNQDSYFNQLDIDGDGALDLVAPFIQYTSCGAPYDANLDVYQWEYLYEGSPYFNKKSPWKLADNGPITFFEKPLTSTNHIALGNTSENGNYRLSYSNYLHSGMFPNSSLKRNNFSMNASHRMFDRLTVSGNANYVRTKAVGRDGTGAAFQTNVVTLLRQWFHTNADLKRLKNYYLESKSNVKFTPGGSLDNPYWVRYENFQSDYRDRFFGNASLNYELTDWINLEGRISVDHYSYLQEERVNNGGILVGSYNRNNSTFAEVNYDLMINYNKNLFDDKLSVAGVFGTNIRRNRFNSIFSETNGGLITDGVYAISNSKNTPPSPLEIDNRLGVDGLYGLLSLGYRNLVYLDVTGRSDHSSTLPSDNNTYFYPSIASSFVFSEVVNSEWLTFGKLRLNYAEVGNSAPVNSLIDALVKPTPFGVTDLYAVNTTKRNENLMPERTKSLEGGVELSFFRNRVSLDLSVYRTSTENQIIPVTVSSATGYQSKYVNAGEMQNSGVEVFLKSSPIEFNDFQWNVGLNFSKNKNSVSSLFEGVDNLQLNFFRGGITLNASVGQPFGVLRGTDFVYLDGKRVIDQSDGSYKVSPTTNNVLGNVNPAWKGGVLNSFRYKKIGVNFVFDMQRGGVIYSADAQMAYANGFAVETAGSNSLGNPIRSPVDEGGGIWFEGVDDEGRPSAIRAPMESNINAFSLGNAPHALYIYDASYVKLREIAVSYELPSRFLERSKIQSIELSATGYNVWILHKNLPYSDPESGLGAGNIQQGFQSGVPPTTRDFSFNIKIQF